MANLDNIDHVVVLMLENRSFDSMLGMLYPHSAGFDGLTGNETNPGPDGQPVRVWNLPGTDGATMTIPDPDPGELWLDMNQQIFGTTETPPRSPATMTGFLANYTAQRPPPPPATRAVMHYFTPEQVPVISRLARQFAVCDQWHAAAPCQTWPNRFFVHTATANGYQNNDPTQFPYLMPTVFNRFPSSAGWKVYFHDMPQSLTLARLWDHIDRFRLVNEFHDDAKNGTLPSYSFIEPRYFPDVTLPNDEHPPHVVTLGEQLIADIYNSLRAGPGWTKTLLVITYDEHGGCYDHVPPPAAVPPGPATTAPFNFDRYGVRVPAVLVSPYIRQGTVLRAPAGGPPFDHTSIIATLRKRFALGPPLSDRDAVALDLEDALRLATPDNLGPPSLQALPYVPSPGEIARARMEPLNGMQQGLVSLAAHLPPLPALLGSPLDVAAFIGDHVQSLAAGVNLPAIPAPATRADAVDYVKQRMTELFKYF